MLFFIASVLVPRLIKDHMVVFLVKHRLIY